MVHVFKDEIKGSSVFAEVHSVSFVRADFFEVDDRLVIELAENFDFTDGRYRKPFFLVFQSNLRTGGERKRVSKKWRGYILIFQW